jgi:hypothetical protein
MENNIDYRISKYQNKWVNENEWNVLNVLNVLDVLVIIM